MAIEGFNILGTAISTKAGSFVSESAVASADAVMEGVGVADADSDGMGVGVADADSDGMGVGESARELLWKLRSKAMQRRSATSKEVCFGTNFHLTALD